MQAENQLASSDIKIVGVSKALEKNIRLHLDQNKINPLALDTENQLNKTTQRALQALGYYHALITISLVDERIYIEIEPNDPVVWGNSRLTIDNGALQVKEIRQYVNNLPIQQGKQLNHKDYEKVKNDLLDLCYKNGFLDAAYKKNELQINRQQKLATLQIDLDCGRRYSFLGVDFQGSKLNESLLSRLVKNESDVDDMQTHVDQYYNRIRLRDIYRNLSDSGYFSAIEIDRELFDEGGVLLHANLQDATKHQILVGVGFSTDTGPRARLQWDMPALNTAGHSLFNRINVAQAEQSVSSRYRIPSPHPIFQFVEYQTGISHEKMDNKEIDIAFIGIGWHRSYLKDWHRVFSLDLKHESSQLKGQSKLQDTYLLPLVTWSKTDNANVPLLQRYRTWITLLSGQTWLGTETNFYRAQIGGKLLISLAEYHQMILRSEIGAMATSSIDKVPLSQRFFTGGDQTVRGYKYETIGRSNAVSNFEGGKYLNVASIEYNWLFRQNWQWALFSDTGRAYNDSSERFSISAGIGIRWQSPIGQLRFDIAQPIDDPDEENPRLHLFFGTDL